MQLTQVGFRLFQPIKQRHSKEGEEACEYCGPPPAEVVTAADIAADIAQAEAELEDMLAEESASPSPVATPEREATPPKRESTPIMCDLRNYEIPNCDDGEWEVPNVGVGMGYDVNDFLGDGWSEMSSDMSYMDDMIDWDEMGDEADS